jgi:hypothetical protein
MIAALLFGAALFSSVAFIFQAIGDLLRYTKGDPPGKNRTAELTLTCLLWGAFYYLTR